MNEEETSKAVPFFINSTRLNTAGSYFGIGRTEDKVREFVRKQRDGNTEVKDGSWQESYYGVNQYIKLDHDPGDDDSLDPEHNEDLEYENTSTFALFWMTIKRIVSFIGNRLYIQRTKEPSSANEAISEVVIDPFFNSKFQINCNARSCVRIDPSLFEDVVTVYSDTNHLIQKLRTDLGSGSVDIITFSVSLPNFDCPYQNFTTDIQSFVMSQQAGSFVWTENGKATAIFIPEKFDPFGGNIMEWFRKILSDMALADSVMIGHPYYWHPSVRRRLQRVMKYLKRLYKTLELRNKQRYTFDDAITHATNMEVIRPKDISKVVISEQLSTELFHATNTQEHVSQMSHQLVRKWMDYQSNIQRISSYNLHQISSSCDSESRQISSTPKPILESTTFLDFYPEQRDSKPTNQKSDSKMINFAKEQSATAIMEEINQNYDSDDCPPVPLYPISGSVNDFDELEAGEVIHPIRVLDAESATSTKRVDSTNANTLGNVPVSKSSKSIKQDQTTQHAAKYDEHINAD